MGVQAYIYDDSCIADEALAQWRVVVAGGTPVAGTAKHVKYPGAVDANAIIGVTQHSTSASGDLVLIRRAGITKVAVASTSVTYGVDLRVFNAEGVADYQSGAWVSGDGILGQAEEVSSTSGDIIECWLNIRTAH